MLNREDKKFLRGVFLKRAKKKIKAPISMKTDEKAQLVEMGGGYRCLSRPGVCCYCPFFSYKSG